MQRSLRCEACLNRHNTTSIPSMGSGLTSLTSSSTVKSLLVWKEAAWWFIYFFAIIGHHLRRKSHYAGGKRGQDSRAPFSALIDMVIISEQILNALCQPWTILSNPSSSSLISSQVPMLAVKREITFSICLPSHKSLRGASSPSQVCWCHNVLVLEDKSIAGIKSQALAALYGCFAVKVSGGLSLTLWVQSHFSWGTIGYTFAMLVLNVEPL